MLGRQKFSRGLFVLIILCFSMVTWKASAAFLLLPMDDASQQNHLKAYGITYYSLLKGKKVKWLLNYRGGSFLLEDSDDFREECIIRGVSYELLSESSALELMEEISSPSQNMEVVLLEKAPKIAVYSPKDNQPWDDAVTMVLQYAEIPYDVIYDQEVLDGDLMLYEWLHLHHEDFTGQFGKFYGAFRTVAWYIEGKVNAEKQARGMGYDKVSQQKLDVALKIRDYVMSGGFMFAMCSATDSFDIALAAEGVDICESMFDGDPSERGYQDKLNFENSFAFTDFILERNPNVYEFSNVDTTRKRRVMRTEDYFELKEFSAKWDMVPSMLCQNHTLLVKGFMGQTTAFDPNLIKPHVVILGQNEVNGEARYIHGVKGKGMFTFFGGHDPEDYQHRVGDPKTELDLHPNSPGYRLILNNVLFPAAKKKKQKT